MTRRRDRGSATVEAVVGVPAFLLFVAVLVAAGRLAIAHQGVEAAAEEAARSASIARTRAEAQSTAAAGAAATLAGQGLRCAGGPAVSVDTSGFAARPGSPASVTATVTCTVDLGGTAVPGLAGARTITTTRTSPIDTYRDHR